MKIAVKKLSERETPNWRSKVIPTSDPKIAEKEIRDKEMIKRETFCVVCRHVFNDTEKRIICSNCSQYAHVECNKKFENKAYCYLCIIKETRVTKQLFKYLYGLMKEYKEKAIRKAGKFTKDEQRAIRNELLQLQYIIRTGLFRRYEVTSKTQKLLKMFEEDIYSNEKDVKEFIEQLDLAKTSLPKISFPFSGNIFFKIVAGAVLTTVGVGEYYIYKNMDNYWWDIEFTIIFMVFVLLIGIVGLYKFKVDLERGNLEL